MKDRGIGFAKILQLVVIPQLAMAEKVFPLSLSLLPSQLSSPFVSFKISSVLVFAQPSL